MDEWIPHESKNYPTSYQDSVWNKDPEKEKYIIKETDTVVTMHDKFPACDGHLLFIPKYNQPRYIAEATAEAYQHGLDEKEAGRCDGFNVGMNIGENAGQSVFWPHIHFIPRKEGDEERKHTGIRSCYPKDAYAPKPKKQDYHEMQKELKKKRMAYIDKLRKELEDKGGGPFQY